MIKKIVLGGIIFYGLFILVSILFTGSITQAQVCTGSYTIDDIDTSGDIAALSGCTEIEGYLTIQYTALTSLAGLDNITSVGEDLYIYDNDALISLSSLSNINSLGGSLYIERNPALTSLSGLENITSVGRDLYIKYTALTSLAGLDNITSVGEDLDIGYNNALTNLCALYNANVAGDELYITHNNSLSMETALALETQLISNGFTGTSSTQDNSGSGLVTCEEDGINLKDYDLTVWDFSGYYTDSRDNATFNFTLIQDAKGILTGDGTFYDQEFYGPDIPYAQYFPVPVEIKGKVKGKDNIVTLKYKVKGENDYGDKLRDNVKLELDEGTLSLVGTGKRNKCRPQIVFGDKCEKTETNVSLPLSDNMTGEAVLLIDAELDGKGKKLEGSGELILSNDDKYPLSVKGKYNSKNDETKYSLKGADESSKAVKVKVTINEGSGDATSIKAKALGQKLQY